MYMPKNLQMEALFYIKMFKLQCSDKNKFLSLGIGSLLLAAGWSWRRTRQGQVVVFGPDAFRGQTVTLWQSGRTRGTAMLNTISWSANGKEFVVVFQGTCLFVWLSVLWKVYTAVRVCPREYCIYALCFLHVHKPWACIHTTHTDSDKTANGVHIGY